MEVEEEEEGEEEGALDAEVEEEEGIGITVVDLGVRGSVLIFLRRKGDGEGVVRLRDEDGEAAGLR